MTAGGTPSTSMRSRVGPLLEGRHGWIAALVVSSALSGFAESGILAILAQVAASLVDSTSRASFDVLHLDIGLGTLLAVAFGLAVFRFALQLVISYIPARVAADMQAQLRSELFTSFTRASWGVQSRDREGQLQEFATNQIAQATAGLLQATGLIVALLTFVVLVVSAFALNVLAALVVLVAATGLFVLLRPLSRLGSRRGHELSLTWVDYASGVNEAVRVAEEVQVFGVGEAQRKRIDGLIDAVSVPYFHTQLLARLAASMYQSVIYVLVVLALVGLYTSGIGHVASLGAVVLLLIRASGYGQQAQGTYQSLRQSLPALEQVQDLRRSYDENVPKTGDEPLERVGSIAFEDVSFSYEPSRPVLRGIDFEVAAGETIGIIGPTGAGKSTVVQILLGLRSPSAGRYLVNGVPAERFRREDWHRAVAYLPQEPRLLHTTVADNIRFFREVGDEAIERAARLAGIHEDVASWPAGYETVIGPRADAVSGGQQQRICLARALVARPEVLVLDEPTSALDPHTERLIQDSLSALKHELTLFVVAHRMSTLDICDRVMVVLDGRLEAFDTIGALETNSRYYRATTQLATALASDAPPDPDG